MNTELEEKFVLDIKETLIANVFCFLWIFVTIMATKYFVDFINTFEPNARLIALLVLLATLLPLLVRQINFQPIYKLRTKV